MKRLRQTNTSITRPTFVGWMRWLDRVQKGRLTVQTQELIKLLELQSNEIAQEGHAGWGNTMLEAAAKLERYVLAMDHIYNENDTARAAVIKHFGFHHK